MDSPLTVDRILPYINSQNIQLEIFQEIDSTNTYLLNKQDIPLHEIHVAIAEAQTGGRGRGGKVWQSPYGQNIYLSVLLHFPKPAQQLSGLSLVIGCSLISVLESLGIQSLEIKWPNDILYHSQKLAGILIETTRIQKEACAVVIGMGLNVNMQAAEAIEQAWTSLFHITSQVLDRNILIAKILNQVVEDFALFIKEGFRAFQAIFLAYSFKLNQPITILKAGVTLNGVYQGVNEQGSLLLDCDGKVLAIEMGEVSFRA